VTILCENSGINDIIMKKLSEWVSLFKNVDTLKLSLKCNMVSMFGFFKLMKVIGLFEELVYLEMNFEGVG
jgi:hypothetical protein